MLAATMVCAVIAACGSDESAELPSSNDGHSDAGTAGGGGSSLAPSGVVGFADIQLDLENSDGSRGAHPSCTNGSSCHRNPARHVLIVPQPDADQLRENWEHIVSVPAGVTPWVTPRDDSAQMLNEVPVRGAVRERWLAWIRAGAPFEVP